MTVYLDMDGVIADFFGKLEDDFGADHWKDIKNIERCLNEIRNTDFFYEIPAFAESADIFVESAKQMSSAKCSLILQLFYRIYKKHEEIRRPP